MTSRSTSWRALLLYGYLPLFLFAAAVAVTLRYQSHNLPGQGLKAGDVASVDIYSPDDFRIVDEESTQRRRKEARDRVRSVYDFSSQEHERILERVQEAFAVVRSLLTERAADPDLATLAERKFEDAIGVELSAEEFHVLWINHFSNTHEQALRKLLEAVSKDRPIVSSRLLLKTEEVRGITRRIYSASGMVREELVDRFDDFVDMDDAREFLRKHADSLLGGQIYNSRSQMIAIAGKLLRPTLTFNQAETERRRQEAYASDHNIVPIMVRKGGLILRKGNVVEPQHVLIFEGMAQDRKDNHAGIMLVGAFLAAVLLVEVIRNYAKNFLGFRLRKRDYMLLASSALLVLVLGRLTLFIAEGMTKAGSPIPIAAYNYLLPLVTVAMLVRMVVGSEAALLVSIMMSILGALLLDNSIYFGLYFFLGSLFGANAVATVRKRTDLLKAGVMVGGLNVVTVLVLMMLVPNGMPSMDHWHILADVSMAFGAGLLSAFLATVMLTLAEVIFNYTTDFKLLELASQNSPLLRELMVQAPGTYHHSIIIGSLSEAASNAIGENGLLARVACLYHDIGKTKMPLYFIENQTVGENRHDKLTPRMSARVIQAHVKEGIEMAEEAKIPREIIDIIPQHHGTRLISFFYKRAKNQADPEMETIDEKDFRYEGPRPQTRIAGIILLSDGLEAITRTLDDPTPARIKGVVQDHINKIFAEGELNETDLTLRDLSAIGNAFTRVLTSIFHHRIDYPTTSVDYPTSVGTDLPRLRKVHDHQDSKSAAKDSTRPSDSPEGDTEDTPRLKIT